MYDHTTFTAKMKDRKEEALNEVAGISGFAAGMATTAELGLREVDVIDVLKEIERRLDAAIELGHRPPLATLVTPVEDGVEGWIEEATSWAYNVAVVEAELDSDNPPGAVVVEHLSMGETSRYVVANFPYLAKGVSAIPYVLCSVCETGEAVGDAGAHECDAHGHPYPSVLDDVCADCLPDAYQSWCDDQWAQLAEDRAADKLRGW